MRLNKITAVLTTVLTCHCLFAQTETSSLAWHNQIGSVQAWNRGFTGAGTVIAVIDNGFDVTHRDFTGKILATKNFVNTGPVTWGQHGTLMAGIAAASNNSTGALGVAPMAKLLFAQAGLGGQSNYLSETAVSNAVRWASAQNATVINMSFGDSDIAVRYNSKNQVYVNQISSADRLTPDSPLRAFQSAAANGSILVFAAGNDSRPFPNFPGNYVSRSENSKLLLQGRALVVGAVDAENMIASYSNRAAHVCQTMSGQTCTDPFRTRDYFVVAPGTAVGSQANQLTKNSNTAITVAGTSAAAAYVSGSIAVIKQAWPYLLPEHVVQLLLITAKDLGAKGPDDVYGRGLIDLGAATAPVGILSVPNTKNTLGQSAARNSSLINTQVTGPVASKLRTSSVITGMQVLDSFQRNYTADLSSLFVSGPLTYNALSPYQSQWATVPVWYDRGDHTWIFRTGSDTVSTELIDHKENHRFHYQLGVNNEHQGFLSNTGTGAMNFGSSHTGFAQFGISYLMTDHAEIKISYGMGMTATQSGSDNMIKFSKYIWSDTAQIALSKHNFLQTKDNFTVGLGYLPRITHGKATITAVTGYEFDNTSGDHVQARPVTTQESIDLRSQHDPHMFFTYMMPVNTVSQLSVNLTANTSNHRLDVKYTMRF